MKIFKAAFSPGLCTNKIIEKSLFAENFNQLIIDSPFNFLNVINIRSTKHWCGMNCNIYLISTQEIFTEEINL
jgi:hypothetical protein